MKFWKIPIRGGHMKQVCVLGSGQLGRMLRRAGEPLGQRRPGRLVWMRRPTAVPVQQNVITAEMIERWPETALTRELARHRYSSIVMYFRSSPTV